MPSLRVRIKNQVHKGLLEQKDAERLISALDHEDERIISIDREEPKLVKETTGGYGQLLYKCPKCSILLAVRYDTRYCEHCGQKLSFIKRVL